MEEELLRLIEAQSPHIERMEAKIDKTCDAFHEFELSMTGKITMLSAAVEALTNRMTEHLNEGDVRLRRTKDIADLTKTIATSIIAIVLVIAGIAVALWKAGLYGG